MSRTGMEDVFGMPMGGAASLGTGPGVISSQPDKFAPFDDESNGFGGHMGRGGDGGGYPGGRNNRHHMQGGMQNNVSYISLTTHNNRYELHKQSYSIS